MNYHRIALPLFIFLAFCTFTLFCDMNHISKNFSKLYLNQVKFLYSKPKDTIHILSDEYVLISLKKQTATVISRNGNKDGITFPVSTGHSGISQGMATPPGLFTVQSKLSKAISRQFNNAELIYWVGFNGNIGFHGLASSGYYSHLGVRPSSHGCVRISREDGKKLFDLVHLGTPVLVYGDEPAISIAFSDIKDYNFGTDILLEKKDKASDLLIKSRLNALYNGEYYKVSNNKIFIDGKTIIRNRGFVVGLASKISAVQRDFNLNYKDDLMNNDITKVSINNKIILAKSDFNSESTSDSNKVNINNK